MTAFIASPSSGDADNDDAVIAVILNLAYLCRFRAAMTA